MHRLLIEISHFSQYKTGSGEIPVDEDTGVYWDFLNFVKMQREFLVPFLDKFVKEFGVNLSWINFKKIWWNFWQNLKKNKKWYLIAA